MYSNFLLLTPVRSCQHTCHAGNGCGRCFTSAANATLHPQTVWVRTLTPMGPGQLLNLRTFADLPAHSELTMPSLSPTMNQVMLCYLCLHIELCHAAVFSKHTSQAGQLTILQAHSCGCCSESLYCLSIVTESCCRGTLWNGRRRKEMSWRLGTFFVWSRPIR